MKNKNNWLYALIVATITLIPSAWGEEKVKPPLSIDELGFNENEVIKNPELQRKLERRASLLKTHQTLALATTVPMLATFLTGEWAENPGTKRNIHIGMGLTTAALYWTAASFAIFTPEINEQPTRGGSKLHKALAWIHGPAMFAVPILGFIAKGQHDRGEKTHGLANLHAPTATVLVLSYLAAAAVMTFDISF